MRKLIIGMLLLFIPCIGFCADYDPILEGDSPGLTAVFWGAIPASDHSAIGPKCDDIAAGESITVMDCVYLKSDGEWWKTDADAVTTAGGMLAISLESKTDGQAMIVTQPGSFIRDDSWAWTVGGSIYLDTATAGGLTQTAPSGADDVVRIVGHATAATRMFFNPDQTVIVHN